MSDLNDSLAALDRLAAEAEALTEEVPGGALVPTAGTNLPATAMKQALARKRADLVKKRAEVERVKGEIKARLDAELDRVAEILGPMQAMVKRLEEGIWTVNLYLGRDEEILTLAEGEPAPAETPITVRQLVLSMAEETLIAVDTGGIDARKVEDFDKWVTASPEHLAQVLPEQRGVVVLQPRATRDQRDYGDPWVTVSMGEANMASYWLIRNGEQLYRMATAFRVGDRLVPTREEFTAFFVDRRYNWETHDYDSVPLSPGSSAWVKAEEAADARRRHYMRVALILQGLVDRTTVFHPLPGAQVSFLTETSYDEGHVRIVTDAELALTTGRTPFREWQRRLNGELRPGMRIIGAFGSEGFYQANKEEYGARRVYPRTASNPASRVLHRIETEAAGAFGEAGLKFLYERTDEVWDEYEEPVPNRPGYVYRRHAMRKPKTRASCIIHRSDDFVLPFDLVTVDELRYYLEARTERSEYLTMIPVIRAAIEAKEAEAAEEAPFRLMLAGAIDRENGEVDPERLDELVHWWKIRNRWHRPLVGQSQEEQAKAVRMIVAEDARRRSTTTDAELDARAVSEARERHRDALLVARRTDGSVVTLTPQAGAPDERVWVVVHTLSPKGRSERSNEWVIGPRYRDWRLLWTSPGWETWERDATRRDHLTGPEEAELIEKLIAACDRPVVAVTAKTERRRLRAWSIDVDESAIGQVDRLLTSGRYLRYKSHRRDLHWSGGGRSGPTSTVRDHWADETHRAYHGDDLPWVGERHRLVYLDAKLLAQAEAAIARLKVEDERRAALQRQASELHQSLRDQWRERVTAEAYARFLEDYADPDLWEGHLKALRLPEFPVKHSPSYRNDVDPVEWYLQRAIEQGLAVEGLTVQQLVVLVGEPPPPDEFGRTPEVPESILDLVLTRPVDDPVDDPVDEDEFDEG